MSNAFYTVSLFYRSMYINLNIVSKKFNNLQKYRVTFKMVQMIRMVTPAV